MAFCVDRAAAFQLQLCSIPTVVPCYPYRIASTGLCYLGTSSSSSSSISVAPAFGALRTYLVVAGPTANSSCTGGKFRWAVRHGDVHRTHHRSNRGVMSSMAVAPSTSSEAAGVTESGKFSQSDEDLASRGLSCHSTIDDLDLDQLNSLFSKVSFPQREKGKLQRALQNTSAVAWVQEAKSKRLVGFARATGDGVFHAIIWDVVVDPGWQGLGLGKVLMERLMADLVGMGISNIALYAEPTVVAFYQPLGFIADPDGIRAMAYSRPRSNLVRLESLEQQHQQK